MILDLSDIIFIVEKEVVEFVISFVVDELVESINEEGVEVNKDDGNVDV